MYIQPSSVANSLPTRFTFLYYLNRVSRNPSTTLPTAVILSEAKNLGFKGLSKDWILRFTQHDGQANEHASGIIFSYVGNLFTHIYP